MRRSTIELDPVWFVPIRMSRGGKGASGRRSRERTTVGLLIERFQPIKFTRMNGCKRKHYYWMETYLAL